MTEHASAPRGLSLVHSAALAVVCVIVLLASLYVYICRDFCVSRVCGTMGRCCVPMCRGNYDGGPKVRLFSFLSDPKRRAEWQRAVRRDDVDVAQLKDPKVSEIVHIY